MMDPTVFSETEGGLLRPVFVQQGNVSDMLNRSSSIMSGINHQNPTHDRNLHRVSTYDSEPSNPQQENHQLTALFNVPVGGYKLDENVNLTSVDNIEKQDNASGPDIENFTERSCLVRQKTTQAEAKHVCNICNRAFVRDDKLKRHIRCVHSHERPFVCEICTKAFARKARLLHSTNRDKLQEHARHHNRDITFTCPVCSDVFVMRSHLNRHLRTIHQMKPTSNTTNLSSNCNPAGGGGTLSLIPDPGLSGSAILGDRIKSFAGNGTTYEKIKSTRSKPIGKRSRKKTSATADSPPQPAGLPGAPLGKSVGLSGSSAFSAPRPLASTGANFLADSLLTSPGECLSAVGFPPVQQHRLHHQSQQYGQMAAIQTSHHQQSQQQEVYSVNADMPVNYFIHHQHQQQLQQQQHQHQSQQQTHPPQHSAFSAAMAASLFSPVNYVGWWPQQASPGLMLHHPQHTATSYTVGGVGTGQHPGVGFPSGAPVVGGYPGSQPETTNHFSRADSVISREAQLPQSGLAATTREAGGETAAVAANNNHDQFALQDNNSQLVRPNAATAAHMFASLPPLAQAVYYQAATLAATHNGGTGSPASGAGGSGPVEPQSNTNRFAPGVTFHSPANSEQVTQ